VHEDIDPVSFDDSRLVFGLRDTGDLLPQNDK
jgi:hypothetical protein